MKILSRKNKPFRKQGHYYFTEYGSSPASVSLVFINDNNLDQTPDRKHYHKKGYEFYVTVQGKGMLDVNGQLIDLLPESVVMVEPGEKHFVKDVLKTPFSMVIFNTVNKNEDKVEI